MRHLGTTGSRDGLSKSQAEALETWLDSHDPSILHHGDCIGADAEVAGICRVYGWELTSHPPMVASFRARVPSETVLPEQPYLLRNKDIVDASELLIAFPKGPEIRRSGTWATVRYAKRAGKEVLFLGVKTTQ